MVFLLSMESRSYKKIPDSPQRVIWIEILGNRDEFKSISDEFDNVENVHFKGKLAYPPGAMALPPYEIFFSIIAAARSFATIAEILHKYLINKKNDKEKLVVFKFDEKEMTIKGNYSKEEISRIIQGFSKVAEVTEINAIHKERLKELKAELNGLRKIMPTYKKLVDIGEVETKPSNELKAKLAYYRKRKSEIESKIALIEDLLSETKETN